jgi:hypothetical protein
MKTSNNAPTNLSYPADLKTELGLLVDERGIYRESVRSTEIGERVLAGRNIAPDLAALNRVAGIAIRHGHAYFRRQPFRHGRRIRSLGRRSEFGVRPIGDAFAQPQQFTADASRELRLPQSPS